MRVIAPKTQRDQYRIENIEGLSALWSDTLGDSRIRMAVLDGPVDLAHPVLRGANLELVKTGISQASLSGAAAAHGTHVASIVLGQHGSVVRGIAPQCTGLIAPIFQDSDDGRVLPCSQVVLAKAIRAC